MIYAPLTVALLFMLLLTACQGSDRAREWHTADTTLIAATSDSTDTWHFDAEQYLQERLSLLEAEAHKAGSERILHEFRKVINGWVTDSLAEKFWREVRRSHDVINVPLMIEVGQPDDEPVLCPRAIIRTRQGIFMVRQRFDKASCCCRLNYSRIGEDEYREIMNRLEQQYHIFELESDLSKGAENPFMTVLEVRIGERRRMLLYSHYVRPWSVTARMMFAYLDDLFK